MRPTKFFLLTAATFVSAALLPPAASAEAQGLLRRLRERIGPLVVPPTTAPPPTRTLPARPLSPLPQQEAGSPQSAGTEGPPNAFAPSPAAPSSPAARYRSPGGAAMPIPGQSQRALRPLAPIPPQRPDSAGLPPTPSGPIPAPGSLFSGIIPADTDGESPTSRTSIGIRGLRANPGYPAVRVIEILPESRADEAGLRVGDFIFAIDGVATPTVQTLAGQVASRAPGDTVRLRVGRGGEVFELAVPLIGETNPGAETARQTPPSPSPSPLPAAEAEDDSPQPMPDDRAPSLSELDDLGLQVARSSGRRGVIVRDVKTGSAAETAGFQAGDRIVSVDGMMVGDAAALQNALGRDSDEATSEVGVVRENQLMSLDLDPADQPAPTATERSSSDPAGNTAPLPKSPPGLPPGSTPGSLGGSIGSLFGGMFGGTPAGQAEAKPPGANTSPGEASERDDVLELNDQPKPAGETSAATQQERPEQEAERQQKDDAKLQAEIERLQAKLQSLQQQLGEDAAEQ